MMRRRSRRNKSITMLGAILIEAGTMLGIVALAQPTWTRNLIEQFSPALQASEISAPADPVVSAADVSPAAETTPVMQPASDTIERLAMAGWSASDLPIHQYPATPHHAQYSVDSYANHTYYSTDPQWNPRSAIRPIYPPRASTQPMPAWSNSY